MSQSMNALVIGNAEYEGCASVVCPSGAAERREGLEFGRHLFSGKRPVN